MPAYFRDRPQSFRAPRGRVGWMDLGIFSLRRVSVEPVDLGNDFNHAPAYPAGADDATPGTVAKPLWLGWLWRLVGLHCTLQPSDSFHLTVFGSLDMAPALAPREELHGRRVRRGLHFFYRHHALDLELQSKLSTVRCLPK